MARVTRRAALIVALALPTVACGLSYSAPPTSNAPPGGHVSASPSLDAARALVGLDRATLLERIGASDADLHEGDYGPSAGLQAVEAPPPVAGTVFLDGERVVLVHLYRGFSPPAAATIFAAIRPDTLTATHPGATRLRSSSGKTHNHYVDPAGGVAWSAGEGEVTSIEVFAPTDLESYKKRFYEDPGPFYK